MTETTTGMAAGEATDNLAAFRDIIRDKRINTGIAVLNDFDMGEQQIVITEALIAKHSPKRAAVMLMAMAKDAEARA